MSKILKIGYPRLQETALLKYIFGKSMLPPIPKNPEFLQNLAEYPENPSHDRKLRNLPESIRKSRKNQDFTPKIKKKSRKSRLVGTLQNFMIGTVCESSDDIKILKNALKN